MNENVKEQAAANPPKSGWREVDTRERLLTQLDAATGNLTGDQQQYYADLPSEEYSTQPSTGHKIISTGDGGAEYHQLVAHDASWKDPATGNIYVNGAVRP
jgi:hypothetical protein